MNKRLFYVLCSMSYVLISCGHSGELLPSSFDEAPANTVVTNPTNAGNPSTSTSANTSSDLVSKMVASIDSPQYQGELIFSAKDYNSAAELQKRYPEITFKTKYGDPQKLDRERRRLEKVTGRKLPDLRRHIVVAEKDKAKAKAIFEKVARDSRVEAFYPRLKGYPPNINTVPDLTGQQGYLNDLSIPAVWLRGVTGQNTSIGDEEGEPNWLHSDFPASVHACLMPDGASTHATAVMGILIGVHNGHGIDGISPDSGTCTPPGGAYPDLIRNGASLHLVEEQTGNPATFPSSENHCTNEDQTECVSMESALDRFEFYQMETAFGIPVILPAANGAFNLDTMSYLPGWPDLSWEDSGAIMVGASVGAPHVKAPFGNCGRRVNLFAWGNRVVTTSLPGRGLGFDWDGPGNPNTTDPNTYFTNQFSGTSPAGSIIAGTVSLLQSYAMQQMGSTYKQITPEKIREILEQSGTDAVYPPDSSVQACPAPPYGLHLDAPACPSGQGCFAMDPHAADHPCTTDNDCIHYGSRYTINPQCVGGQCGSSFCSARCNAGNSCNWNGWLIPTMVGSDCYCIPQYVDPNSGCNIGKQPRMDVAMSLFDSFWRDIQRDFPEIGNRQEIKGDRRKLLRQRGIQLICNYHRPDLSDINCPETAKCVLLPPDQRPQPVPVNTITGSNPLPLWDRPFDNNNCQGSSRPACIDIDYTQSDYDCAAGAVWPTGTEIGKPLDFDGDGKADLVSWTKNGWKIDLSSKNNLGAWDVQFNTPMNMGRWVWPVVEDYNSDGRADLAVWDKEHGIWYIAFTNNALLNGQWHGWDWQITLPYHDELNRDVWQAKYSRPVPGDYNGDGYMDLALQTSDGYWRIDFGGPNRSDYGSFDLNVKYLTDAQLAAAPGWAYLPVEGTQSLIPPSGNGLLYGSRDIVFKIPDGITGAGKIIAMQYDGTPYIQQVPLTFGGNEVISLVGNYFSDYTVKHSDGRWEIAVMDDFGNWSLSLPSPNGMFGGPECHPFLVDCDGDGIDDRAVQCPTEFRIALSSTGGVLHIPLGYNQSEFTLPGKPYYGGISYADTMRLIQSQLNSSNEPPIIPVDMVQAQFVP